MPRTAWICAWYVAAAPVAWNVIVDVTVPPLGRFTGLELNETVGPEGITLEERAIDPESPFRLLKVAVVVPISPEMNEILVGLIVKVKS